MEEVNVPGVTVTLGKRVLTLPPLNFKALKRLTGKLATYNPNSFDEATLELATEVVESALRRNYNADDVARDFIEEYLDVGNMQELMEAAMDVSGLKRKAQEQETQAGRSGDPLTGGASTASS